MSYDINREIVKSVGNKKLFLFDTGVFSRSEEMSAVCGVDFVDVFMDLPDEHFFISNEVLLELSRGPRKLNLGYFQEHILNVEGCMDPNWKENRFLVEENGKTTFVVLNKISSVDYMQVLLCQNHKELTLVSNDRKLLKSAVQVIPGRVWGGPVLVERLAIKYPRNKALQKLRETMHDMYELKNALNPGRTMNRVRN